MNQKNRVTGIVLFLLVLFPACNDFTITESTLAEVGNVVIPLVEKATGVSLQKEVPLRLTTSKELEQILLKEQEPIFLAQMDDKKMARDALEAYCHNMATGLMAKYSMQEGAVLVCPENLDLTAELIDEPGLKTREALCAILAHEYVHAADQIKYGFFEKLLSLKKTSRILSMNAVMEGHAQFVARAICKNAGWSNAFEAFTRSVGKMPELKEGEEALKLILRVNLAANATAYYDGEKFIRAINEEGGDSAVERAFREPPLDTEYIYNPSWFLHPEKRTFTQYNFESALDLFGRTFDEESWTSRKVDLMKPQLEAGMSLLPEEDISRILKNLIKCRLIILNPKSAPASRMVAANFSESNSPAEAAFFSEANERLVKIKDEKMKEGVVRILSAKYDRIQHENWLGLYYAKTINANGVQAKVTGILGRRDSLCLEVLFSGEEASREKLIEIGTTLFDSVEAVPAATEEGG
jgi:hypothetical protein